MHTTIFSIRLIPILSIFLKQELTSISYLSFYLLCSLTTAFLCLCFPFPNFYRSSAGKYWDISLTRIGKIILASILTGVLLTFLLFVLELSSVVKRFNVELSYICYLILFVSLVHPLVKVFTIVTVMKKKKRKPLWEMWSLFLFLLLS